MPFCELRNAANATPPAKVVDSASNSVPKAKCGAGAGEAAQYVAAGIRGAHAAVAAAAPAQKPVLSGVLLLTAHGATAECCLLRCCIVLHRCDAGSACGGAS